MPQITFDVTQDEAHEIVVGLTLSALMGKAGKGQARLLVALTREFFGGDPEFEARVRKVEEQYGL